MKKILLFLGLICATSFSMWGQTEQEKINTIKNNLNFIYATGISTISAEDATDNAKELLSLEIDQWLKEVVDGGDYSGYVAKATSKVEEIKTKRGQLIRSFVYVRKTDILPYYKEESIMMVAKDSKPTVDTVVVYNTKGSSKASLPENENVNRNAVPAFVLTDAEREMLTVQTLREVNSYISKGTHSGKITDYGKYDENTKLIVKSYLYLINKEGNVVAVLRKTGSTIVNISSGANVSMGDYRRCGVIWFQINED